MNIQEPIKSQMCQQHIDELMALIERRGMREQCATSDQERLERLTSGNPDPFMDAQMRLQLVAVQMAGRAACVTHPCPVCALRHADWLSLALSQVCSYPGELPRVMRVN